MSDEAKKSVDELTKSAKQLQASMEVSFNILNDKCMAICMAAREVLDNQRLVVSCSDWLLKHIDNRDIHVRSVENRFAAEDISDQFDKMDKFDKECRSLIEHFQNANRESCHAFETLNARICDQWDDQFKEMSTFASDMEERYFSNDDICEKTSGLESLLNDLCSTDIHMEDRPSCSAKVAALTPVAGTSTALAGELPYSCDASGNRRSHRLNQSSAPSRSRNYAATTVYDDDDNEDADEDEDVGSPSKYQENISNKREKSHPHHDSNYKEHATSDPKWSATWQDLKVDGQPSLSSSDDDETGAPKKRKKPNPDDDAYVESNHRHRTISGSDSSDAGEVFSEMKDRIVEPPRSSRFSSGRNSSASSSLSLTALKKVTRSGSRRSVGSRRTTQSTLTDRYSKHTCTEEANIKRAIENSITDSQSQPSESERERPCQEDWITAPSRRSSSSSVVTRREARDRNDIFPVQDLVSDNDDDCEPGAVSEGDAEKAAVASVSKICLSAGSGGVSGGSSGGGSWSSRGRSGGCLRKESEAEALCGTLVKPDSSRARSSAASSFSWTAASHPYRDDRDLPPAARINPMAMVDSLMERVYERKAYGGVSESPETEQDTEIQNDIFLNSAPPPPRQAQAHEDVDPSKHLETIAMHLNINSDDGTYSDPHETRKFNEGSARLLSSANRRHSPEQQDPLSQHEAEAETESAIQSLDVALSPLTPPRRSRRGVSPVISTATATATAMTGSKVAAEQSCRRGGDDGDVIDLTD